MNYDITEVFNGFQKTTFLSLPERSIYWSYDQYFSIQQNATNAFDDSLVNRLGFSYSQLGDIQNIIARNKFPILNSGITTNLKGITTRQQASLGLQLGTSGLGYGDDFTSGSNIQTEYNFSDVVGVFASEIKSLSILFKNNGKNVTELEAIPGQVFTQTLINFFNNILEGQTDQWNLTYIDTNGNSQILSDKSGIFILNFSNTGEVLSFEIRQIVGDTFPENMTNPTLTFVQSSTASSKSFIGLPILTSSRPLDAQNLPDLLAENNFYLIYSNIVNNNFYSANQGDKAGGIVGICSLQFAANDTLFNTEAIQFTVNQTTILDQIIVRLTNPDGTSPPNAIIDKNSAFIFIIETQVFPTS
jgi:hypothetical protein